MFGACAKALRHRDGGREAARPVFVGGRGVSGVAVTVAQGTEP